MANIASPNSVANITVNPGVCVNLIDVVEQRGLKLQGRAIVIISDDPVFEDHLTRLRVLADEHFLIQSIIEINIEETSLIQAPSYFLFPEVTLLQQLQSGLDTYGVVRKPEQDPDQEHS